MLIAALIFLLLLVFAVLIFVFRKVMTQNVTLATQHLEELNQDYTRKEQEVNRQLDEAKVKSQEIIALATQEAEKLKLDIIQNAEKERDNIVNQARTQSEEIIQQADKSRQQLIGELEQRIAKEAVNKACELIQDTLPEQFKQDVHAHWIDDLLEEGFTKLERLHIPDDLREVKVTSAFSLSEEQRKNLAKKLKTTLGREVTFKEEVNPKVVAGLIITIGSLVLDGSLKNRIQEKAR